MSEKSGEMLLHIVHLISNGKGAAAIKLCNFNFLIRGGRRPV